MQREWLNTIYMRMFNSIIFNKSWISKILNHSGQNFNKYVCLNLSTLTKFRKRTVKGSSIIIRYLM